MQICVQLQTVKVAGSVADTADETGCLPNFLRFCPATSTSSSGQECPTVAFDRPYGVYPEIENQVSLKPAKGAVCTSMVLLVPGAFA